jgi:hypothetical protein
MNGDSPKVGERAYVLPYRFPYNVGQALRRGLFCRRGRHQCVWTEGTHNGTPHCCPSCGIYW